MIAVCGDFLADAPCETRVKMRQTATLDFGAEAARLPEIYAAIGSKRSYAIDGALRFELRVD